MNHDLPHPTSGSAVGVGWELVLPLCVLLVCAAGYLLRVRRAWSRNPGRGWPTWRTVSFLAGLGLLAVALLPPLAQVAHTDFRGHMAQHLLIGMYAPLGLMLGAPVTLLLRTLAVARARRLTALLGSRPVRLFTHPAVALALSIGGLAALYFTPLHPAVTAAPAGHWVLHIHFLLSGCLFTYVIAGPDPAPRRPGVYTRLACLAVAIAGHAIIAQMMYGGLLVRVDAPASELRGAAEIMYYGGDIAELLLATALVTTWHPERPLPGTRRAGRARRAVGSGHGRQVVQP